MFFISEHSTSNINGDVYGTLIGIHNGYLYSANSFREELNIYRKKVINTGSWELVWNYKISNQNTCFCSEGVSAAYGIIGGELYVASYGMKTTQNDFNFHLSSMNLETNVTIDYESNHIPSEISKALCNECCGSYVLQSPNDPSQIIITPWHAEPLMRFSFETGSLIDCFQLKLKLDIEKKVCTFQESIGIIAGGLNIQSNIGVIDLRKAIQFHDNELVLVGTDLESERKLEIIAESDLKECSYAGFYSSAIGLYCLAFEKVEDSADRKVNLYTVSIDEEKLKARFTHKAEISNFPKLCDPRPARFIIDSRSLICYCGNYVFTFIFGMLSLSEASFLAASNFSSSLYCNQKYHYENSIYDGEATSGLTRNEIKQILRIPSYHDIVSEIIEEC